LNKYVQVPICDHNCVTRIPGFILAVAEEQVTYKEGIRATLQEVAQFSSFLAATTPSDVKIVFHVGTTLSQPHDTRQAYQIQSTLYTQEYLYHSNSTQMVISLLPGLHGQESDGISRNSYC
jgi:hypothetical protein